MSEETLTEVLEAAGHSNVKIISDNSYGNGRRKVKIWLDD